MWWVYVLLGLVAYFFVGFVFMFVTTRKEVILPDDELQVDAVVLWPIFSLSLLVEWVSDRALGR